MFVCDITTSILGTRCMQSTNIYKVKPIVCFWSKNVRTGCKRQGQRMREGRGGLATCVCNANEHGPPQLFLHCCAPMEQRVWDDASGIAYTWHTSLGGCHERPVTPKDLSAWRVQFASSNIISHSKSVKTIATFGRLFLQISSRQAETVTPNMRVRQQVSTKSESDGKLKFDWQYISRSVDRPCVQSAEQSDLIRSATV